MESLNLEWYEKETLKDVLDKINVYVNTSYAADFRITPKQQEHIDSILKKLNA